MFLGIDIGGHAIKAGITDGVTLKNTFRVSVSEEENTETFFHKIKLVVNQFNIRSLKAVGIGVPGIVNPVHGIVYDIQNIPQLKEVHLKKELESAFQLPVFVNNDANCFALGESYFGYGKNYKDFLGVTIGTGLGTGIILNKHLYSGVLCGAGEIGMLPYKDSIVEHYAGSRFFEKHNTTGSKAYQKALQNDHQALTLFKTFGTHLGNAVNIMLHTYAPEAIILGGSISKAYSFYESSLTEKISTFPFKKQLENFKIHVSEQPDMGILGAAALGLEFTDS